MSELRLKRVSQEIKKVLGDLIDREIKDPRISETFITVTNVLVTPDFKYAKAYISVFDKEKVEDVFEGLESAKGFIRKEVGRRVKLRFTPDFNFVLDESMEYAIDMSKLIDKVIEEDENKNR